MLPLFTCPPPKPSGEPTGYSVIYHNDVLPLGGEQGAVMAPTPSPTPCSPMFVFPPEWNVREVQVMVGFGEAYLHFIAGLDIDTTLHIGMAWYLLSVLTLRWIDRL